MKERCFILPLRLEKYIIHSRKCHIRKKQPFDIMIIVILIRIEEIYHVLSVYGIRLAKWSSSYQ